MDALQVAAKRWRAIKLQHDGREICLRDWRGFRGQYGLFHRNVEDWDEGDGQSCLPNLLPDAWIKRITKEEAKTAKSNHTVKMMLNKENHKKVVNWKTAKVAEDFNRQSLRNALLISVLGDREKAAVWRLHECDVGGQTICLQGILARIMCWSGSEWKYSSSTGTSPTAAACKEATTVSAMWAKGLTGKLSLTRGALKSAKVSGMMTTRTNQLTRCLCLPGHDLHKGSSRGSSRPLQQIWKKREKQEPCRVGDPLLSLGSSSKLILRAASSTTGGTSPSNTITEPVRPTRPTRRRTKRRTCRRSVRQPTSGKPRWKCPKTSSPR